MILLAIAVPLLLSAQPSMKVSDEDAVRSAFSRYREALMKKDGAAAADAVDAGTIAYYARILEFALGADAATTKKQSMIDRMMIVRLRHEVGAQPPAVALGR